MNNLWRKYNWPALIGMIAIAVASTLHLYTASIPLRHAVIQTVAAVLMAVGSFFVPPQRGTKAKGKGNARGQSRSDS